GVGPGSRRLGGVARRLVPSVLPQRHTLPRRHAKQLGDAPDDILLAFVDVAVCVSELPEHADELAAAFLVERTFQDAGEMIEIDGLALALGRMRDQVARLRMGEIEALFDESLHSRALVGVELAVDGGDMDEQRSGGQMVVLVLENALLRRLEQLADEALERVEHSRWDPTADAALYNAAGVARLLRLLRVS